MILLHRVADSVRDHEYYNDCILPFLPALGTLKELSIIVQSSFGGGKANYETYRYKHITCSYRSHRCCGEQFGSLGYGRVFPAGIRGEAESAWGRGRR